MITTIRNLGIGVFQGRIVLLVTVLLFSLFQPLHAETLIPITVEKGANLIKITKKFCKHYSHWKEIAKLNGAQDPYIIYPNDVLYIPLPYVKVELVSAQVASVYGGVYVLQNNKEMKRLKKGDLIHPGQTIVTEKNGFAHIIFPDYKYTRVSSDSKFTLTYLLRLSDGSLQANFFLKKGEITHHVKQKLKKNETYTTITPVSVTGVRGTDFRVKMDTPNTSLVESLEGNVEVGAQDKHVFIASGSGTKVVKGMPPTEPQKLPEMPVVPDNIQDLYKALPVKLNFSQLINDGHSVRLRLAKDPSGRSLVADELASQNGNLLLVDLPDGIYYGFLTIIDGDSFESLPSKPFSFTLRTTPGAPLLSSPFKGAGVFSAGIETKWLKMQGAEKYKVEISNDVQFDKILDQTIQKDNNYRVTALKPGKYFYRVMSIADDGFESDFSITDHWKVMPGPAIKNTSYSENNEIVLEWKEVEKGVVTELQIASDPTFGDVIAAARGITSSKYAMKKDLDQGEYYVRTRNSLGNGVTSNWSPYSTFDVKPERFGWLDAGVLAIFLIPILL